MAKNRNICFLLLMLIILPVIGEAQVNRYMVFFTDKEGTAFDLNKPDEFLSPRAIARRIKYNIPVTTSDLPVNVNYINAVQSEGVAVFFQTKWLNGVLVQVDQNLIPGIEQLSFVKEVRFVAPGARLAPSTEPPDLTSKVEGIKQTSISNALQNKMLGVDRMHEDGYTGKDIMIGVFDAGFTGVDISQYFLHLFEQNKIIAARDFVRNSSSVFQYDDHGTGVLSTISGFSESAYEGIAYDADVVLCVTEDTSPEHVIEEYNWLFAAEYADSLGVDIINTSLGYNTFDEPSMNYTYESMDGNTAIITRATDMAASRGILCIVSVGNEGNNNWKKLVAPADADSVISVGAVDANLNHVSFSSTGPTADGRIKPEVVALGQSTKIVQYDGSLSSGSGTSFASPLIAGLAAGLWEAYPELNNMELLNVIIKGSSQYSEPDTLLGYGLPDYRNIQSMITSVHDRQLPEDFMKIYPNPVDNKKLFIELTEATVTGRIRILIHDINGKSLLTIENISPDPDHKLELDLSGLRPGLYLLNVSSGGSSGSVKILIP